MRCRSNGGPATKRTPAIARQGFFSLDTGIVADGPEGYELAGLISCQIPCKTCKELPLDHSLSGVTR